MEEPVGGSEMTRNVHLVKHNKAHRGGGVVVYVVQWYVQCTHDPREKKPRKGKKGGKWYHVLYLGIKPRRKHLQGNRPCNDASDSGRLYIKYSLWLVQPLKFLSKMPCWTSDLFSSHYYLFLVTFVCRSSLKRSSKNQMFQAHPCC